MFIVMLRDNYFQGIYFENGKIYWYLTSRLYLASKYNLFQCRYYVQQHMRDWDYKTPEYKITYVRN